MSIIEKLTEGIMSRDVQKEGQALLNKWEKTGLMEGIESDYGRNNMACLLENQAKELLREASTMAGGSVEGFAAVAFPIVRRVFGGLIANELVSVQPMSLPSGLIFFLDFQHTGAKLGYSADDSVYGGNKVGRQITGGVDLGSLTDAESRAGGFYNLNNGYASPTGSNTTLEVKTVASGTFGTHMNGAVQYNFTGKSAGDITGIEFSRLCNFDADFISGTTNVWIGVINSASTTLKQNNSAWNQEDTAGVLIGEDAVGTITNGIQVKRLTQFSGSDQGRFKHGTDTKGNAGLLVYLASDTATVAQLKTQGGTTNDTSAFPIVDAFTGGGADVGSVVGTTAWGLENTANIPEIDIKVDSVSVTALTKKLKAKWTPELQQDINAYHNLDAEVELTGILSETIALEIDQEILEDLVNGASAGTRFWSRKPGKFVSRDGKNTINESLFPDFTGTVSEWYETLLETVNDVSAQIHRKTLRGGANFLVCSPEVANVLEFTSGFRADTTADEAKGTAGAMKVGAISKKWDVYVDPYFPRNVILVGRKGGSFLESGYVYAPYVPLQVTPTIFDPDSFVPRKGVMTRYGKKMVRPDMYGLVIVEDLLY